MSIAYFMRFMKRGFILEMRRLSHYRASLLLVSITIPLWSLVQIVFIETIYRQTSNFAGYGKFETYMLFGTLRIIQGICYFLFYKRIGDIKFLIRGNMNETFDNVLLKPIDAQIFSSVGKFNVPALAHLLVGIAIMEYGVHSGHIEFSFFQFGNYLIALVLGMAIFYVTALSIRSLLFWVEELDITEPLWQELLKLGGYPNTMYQGAWGIILNVVFPVTLMGAIPVDFLLGKKGLWEMGLYCLIMLGLLVLCRLWWKLSVRQYASSSS